MKTAKEKYMEEYEDSINLECKKCGYKWLRRDMQNMPKCCPRCKAPRYFETRRR